MKGIAFKISDKKQELLDTKGPLLILGGPGSGKTTIALLKAQKIIVDELQPNRKVLFLSFARATITRVEEKAKGMIDSKIRKNLEINTYHGFIWNLLRSHGYLINSHIPIKLLTPPEAASALADIEKKDRRKEKTRLFEEEGKLHFDLFANYAAELLSSCKKIASIISEAYPVIILDEFQDTNQDEWDFIQELGKGSTLIALADLEQRIYEFRGADPARIGQFNLAYKPENFDFGTENHRSSGTDIIDYGNDLLNGSNKSKDYNEVTINKYSYYEGNVHLTLKICVLNSINRLKSEKKDWSIAILVPTKSLMMSVSDYLEASQTIGKRNYKRIGHEVKLEMAGPSLAASMIARLMERKGVANEKYFDLLDDLCTHMRGRKGDGTPSKKVLELSDALLNFIDTGYVRGKNRKAIIEEAKSICAKCLAVEFTGEPAKDWISIRTILQQSSCEEFKQAGINAKYLRLLRKGTILNSGLGELWRNGRNYNGASDLVGNALMAEHFSSVNTTFKGVHIMTMHAAKGKEFDEVIIYEGSNKYRDTIIREGDSKRDIDQKTLALRVAVTRAMRHTTILTPAWSPCPLL